MTKTIKCNAKISNALTALFFKEIMRKLKDEGLLIHNQSYIDAFSTVLITTIENVFEKLKSDNINEIIDEAIKRETI